MQILVFCVYVKEKMCVFFMAYLCIIKWNIHVVKLDIIKESVLGKQTFKQLRHNCSYPDLQRAFV